ncbi:MAG: corrinoid protein [Candidatus Sumerlaeota bacterium]|nr:corrinoid protein [Candidatus Sumerlaeota bacterium]
MNKEELILLLRTGQVDALAARVDAALREGAAAEDILNHALIAGMKALGEDFKRNRVYVPEVIIASRAMKEALRLLEPYLVKSGHEPRGVVILGTVAGDLHDIGKNLVGMMARGVGFDVTDLGMDVTVDRFLEAATSRKPGVIGMSCLLTTTMGYMAEAVAAIKEEGPEGWKIAIGGAPTTQAFADEIGADGYAPDASQAAELFSRLLEAPPQSRPETTPEPPSKKRARLAAKQREKGLS